MIDNLLPYSGEPALLRGGAARRIDCSTPPSRVMHTPERQVQLQLPGVRTYSERRSCCGPLAVQHGMLVTRWIWVSWPRGCDRPAAARQRAAPARGVAETDCGGWAVGAPDDPRAVMSAAKNHIARLALPELTCPRLWCQALCGTSAVRSCPRLGATQATARTSVSSFQARAANFCGKEPTNRKADVLRPYHREAQTASFHLLTPCLQQDHPSPKAKDLSA